MASDLEGNDIKAALDAFRESAQRQAERPSWFWTRQHTYIMSDIRESRGFSTPKLAWVGVAAMAAVAVGLFIPVQTPKPAPVAPAAQVQISDHDLMVALEHSMNAGVPSSLEPAGMLAEEMNQALQTRVQTQKSKERQYEE